VIVCVCKALTERTIREMLEYTDLDSIKKTTGAGTQCESCVEMLDEIDADKKREDRSPP